MPNGVDKNWVRLCCALEGFHAVHGHWPIRVRVYPESLRDLKRHLFRPATWRRITERIAFVADKEAPFIAEDAEGRRFSYGTDGVPGQATPVSAEEWLGVSPDRPGLYEH